ncbi:MAG: glycosyltransferase family 2 protein [Thioalkalivibrio sp.]|nr:glycosyltransferase family 2 protein [Thioalkalivibrio sp.]
MRLSVVIPCYNAESVIGEQLEALTRQEWDHPWEVVLSDNGSTDGSRAVVERFHDRLPSLRIVDSSGTKGVAHARNVGIEQGRGDLILNCDADDVVADDFVATMANALETYDLAACRLEEHRLNEPWIAESWVNGQRDGLLASSPRFLPFAATAALGFKRFVFETVGGFDPTLRARSDNDFCWKAQLEGIPLHFISGTAVHYRYPTSYSHMYRQSRGLADYQVLLYKRYRSLGMVKLPLREAIPRKAKWLKLMRRLVNFRRYDRVRQARFVRDLGHEVGRAKGIFRYWTATS